MRPYSIGLLCPNPSWLLISFASIGWPPMMLIHRLAFLGGISCAALVPVSQSSCILTTLTQHLQKKIIPVAPGSFFFIQCWLDAFLESGNFYHHQTLEWQVSLLAGMHRSAMLQFCNLGQDNPDGLQIYGLYCPVSGLSSTWCVPWSSSI